MKRALVVAAFSCVAMIGILVFPRPGAAEGWRFVIPNEGCVIYCPPNDPLYTCPCYEAPPIIVEG